MDSVPSTLRWNSVRPVDAAEYLICTFVGEKSFPLTSDFWQKLLELPLSLQWPGDRVREACELFGRCRYGVDLAKQLSACLHGVLVSCGSVRISFSERTPEKVSNVIVKELKNNPKVYIWDGADPNPHMGHLAWADAFVVTADSVSMLSEACSTGKPVYVIGAERCTWKLSDFHNTLRDRGMVRPFTGSEDISESWSYPPLTDTAEAAMKVHEALAERGWRLRP